MKNTLLILLALLIFSCKTNSKGTKNTSNEKDSNQADTLFVFTSKETSQNLGYINSKGEIVIPEGKYSQIWTDTFTNFAYVFDEKNTNSKVIAINQKEETLFEAYLFDNYPDEASEGLFRIKQKDKIGFANEKGKIVIPCKYACAFPFEGGKAKVTMECEMIGDEEHQTCQSDSWIYIDKTGKTVK